MKPVVNLLLIFCLGLFLTAPFTALAQEKNGTATPPPKPPPAPAPKAEEPASQKPEPAAYVRYGQMEIRKQDGVQITVFTNKVELYQAGKILKADTLISRNRTKFDGATHNKDIIFDEVYAEGNVKVISENDLMSADRFYYNFNNDTGILINLEIRTTAKGHDGQELSAVIRANIAYQINKSTIVARNASVTSCPHGQPHYYFWAHQVTFIKDESGKQITINHLVPHIVGIPVFYIPYYKKTLGEDSIFRTARYSKSKSLGKSTDVKLGMNLTRYVRDEKGEIAKDRDGYYKTKLWGDLTLEEHVYEKRGLASEPKLEYGWDNYQGFVKSYYINDKGPDPSLKYSTLLYKTPAEMATVTYEERGRFQAFHRQDFSPNLRGDVELYYLSDRYFLPEYFNKESKEEKPPESYAYLRYLRYNKALTLVGQPTMTTFQDKTEYQPSVKAYLMNEPVWFSGSLPSIYYSGTLEFSTLSRTQDNLPERNGYQANRIDSFNELSAPMDVGFIKFTPFVSGRATGYSQNPQDADYTSRFIASEGARVFTQFSRAFDLKEKPLGISKPVHTVSLDIRYANHSAVNVPSSDLYYFDNADHYDELGEWFFEIRNRFKSEKNGVYNEFLNVGLSIERYSKPITGLASNYLYPMSSLTIPPVENLDVPERKISDLNLDVLLTPAAPFSFRTVWQYNTNTHQGEVWYFNTTFVPYSTWTVSVFGNYILDRTDTYGLNLTCSPLEKWELSLSDQYDFRAGDFLNRRYGLKRDMHEFYLEFSLAIDKGKDEQSFNIILSPKGVK
ncbi:MAG: LPS-assembly protein LptD [Planctomycetes bacterium]|nr:LPS-assembly protein LptD [Planctomycetota bacterium]